LEAGAKKEAAYLTRFGRPLHPFQRIRRELVDYQQQSHLSHLENLKRYLCVAADLVPSKANDVLKPTIKHPDLQPNNIFVSKSLEITGLIDWQHCSVLPLFCKPASREVSKTMVTTSPNLWKSLDSHRTLTSRTEKSNCSKSCFFENASYTTHTSKRPCE